jgi:hypothetical protein
MDLIMPNLGKVVYFLAGAFIGKKLLGKVGIG